MSTVSGGRDADFGGKARSLLAAHDGVVVDTDEGEGLRSGSCMWSGPPREFRIPHRLLEAVRDIPNLDYAPLVTYFAEEFRKQLRKPRKTAEANAAVETRCAHLVRSAYRGLLSWAAEQVGIDGAKLSDRILTFMDAEPVLYRLPKGYRDHAIHPLAVLLAGSVVLDRQLARFVTLFDGMTGRRRPTNPVRVQAAWVLAATLHDVGVVLQKWEEARVAHVEGILGFKPRVGSGTLDLPKAPDRDCGHRLGRLASLLTHVCAGRTEPWRGGYACSTPGYRYLKSVLSGRAQEPGSHSVLGALSLLEACEVVGTGSLTDEQSRIVVPAALAIALHHGHGDAMMTATGGNGIRQSQQPLTFLLRMCDLATEWFRPRFEPTPGGFRRLSTGHNLEDFDVGETEVIVECNIGHDDLDDARGAVGKSRQTLADIPELDYRVRFTSERDSSSYAETRFDGV